ncbi:iron-containing alcohol dehydrogenase [Microbulbifer celer]|uniref:Iron-containing alcohol dehydrogenase n=1 Tax=Microbulbifer celer TaxID=435905 RepID=A0ABW3UFJ1_9GAMM|nr:iron-containing alcohol dehydrogenase [Microbulbifer celer]UFN56024.1 iron-containing alcohol dehydrogenase [Microbulbifer celer]
MTEIRLSANWNYPTAIRVGAGRVRELPALCFEFGVRAPLLVTDPGLASLPMINNILNGCEESGLRVEMFANIKGNPSGQNVNEGLTVFRTGEHDGVLAVGGGSALDAAKAVALMAGQSRPLWDFEDEADNYLRVNEDAMAPVIAVPTTAGTGSEVGRSSVITDEDAQLKRIIFHPRMLPEQVILDPELTVGLPANITAATGMDALSHNLEAFCAPNFHPMAEGIALEAMRLVSLYLPRAFVDGNDIEARMQMLVASSMGATAFQRGLGAMHALAHPLGALFDAHHGLLNAILMPYVLLANERVIGEPMERLARYLDLPKPGFGGVLDWVLQLRTDLGIPNSLGEIGIQPAASEKVGEMAAKDPAAGGNPVAFDAHDYRRIFLQACEGQLTGG